jgi:hypothetical protein
MKIIDKVVACVAIGLLVVACQDEQKPGPAELEVQPAAEDLIGLLPNSALAGGKSCAQSLRSPAFRIMCWASWGSTLTRCP